MTLDEDIMAAETAYAESPEWKKLLDRYGEFAQFQHPYTDLAAWQGHIILMSFIKPQTLSPQRLAYYDTVIPLILTSGGSVTFDKEHGQNSLGILLKGRALVPAAAWENRIIQYVSGVMQTLEKVLERPDTDETIGRSSYDVRNGMFYTDLPDLHAYLQTFITAKTQSQGLEAARSLILTRLIQESKRVPHNG